MAAACEATTAPRTPTTTGGECVLAARIRAYELAARRTALTKEWADLLERRAQRVPAERERAAAKWLDWTRALAVEERAKLEVQRLVEAGERRAAEAGGVAYLCALPDDLRRVIIGRLRTALEPRWVVHFSSANKELRALLPLEDRRQLWAEHDEAIILGLKLGTGGSCQALRAKGYICVLRDRLSRTHEPPRRAAAGCAPTCAPAPSGPGTPSSSRSPSRRRPRCPRRRPRCPRRRPCWPRHHRHPRRRR